MTVQDTERGSPPSYPKIELHVHLEGTAPPALIRRLAQRNGLPVPEGVCSGAPARSTSDPCTTSSHTSASRPSTPGNQRITDVLVTGGDPLVMRAQVLRRHLEPFLADDLSNLTIRIGTKALSYNPGRFLDERDSDELLELFDTEVVLYQSAFAPLVAAIRVSRPDLPLLLSTVTPTGQATAHFSQPMQEGVSAEHICLVKGEKDTLKNVFLDLQPELWNHDRTMLTLWLDPGRIKRDLQPNRQATRR